jgi:hypothetical protein
MVMEQNTPTYLSTRPSSPLVHANPVVAGRPRLRHRLAARLRAGALDRALATGVSPEAEPALALRARRLSDLAQRRSIADGLRNLVAEVLPDRAVLGAARAELEQLADALAKPGPVSVRGVAQARILLTDGTGPLYNPRSEASLRARALSAVDSLETPARTG